MKCQRGLLELYIDNRLSKVEATNVEEHLRHCTYCREELNQLQLVVSALQACEAPEPYEPIFTDVMAAIDAEPSPLELELKRRQQFGRVLGWGSSFMAVGLIVVLVTVFGGFIVDGLWNEIMWISSRVAVVLPPLDILISWRDIKDFAGIVIDLLQGNQFLLPVLVISALLVLTMAREIVDDIQRVLGYRE